MFNTGFAQEGDTPRNSIVRDMTGSDLSSHMGLVKSKGLLAIQFFYAMVPIRSEAEAAVIKTDMRLCVAKHPKGDVSSLSVRFITEEEAARTYPREWALFKQNEDVPTDGTPLYELPGLTQSQIARLVTSGLRSIEDVAACPFDTLRTLGREAVEAQKLAEKWVQKKSENAGTIDAAAIEARLTQQNADLLAQNEKLARRLEALELAATMMPQQVQQVAAAPQPMAGTGGVQATLVGDSSYVIPDDVPSGEVEAKGNADLAAGGDPWDK